MVDFGATQFEGAITPSVVSTAPVVDQSGAVLAQGLQQPMQTLAGVVGGVFNSMQQGQNDMILSGLSSELIMLSQAVEQGQLDGASARTRSRELFSRAIANNPSLHAEINQIYTNLTGGRIAAFADTGNEMQQAAIDRQQEAIRNGFTSMEEYGNFQAAANNVAYLNNVFGANEAYRNENERQYNYDMNTRLRELAPTTLPWIRNRIDVAQQQLAAGQDPAAVIASLQSDYANNSAQIRAIAQDVDSEWIFAPMDTLVDHFVELANGSIDTATYEALIARDQARAELSWRADPELGPILQTMDIMGDNFPMLQTQAFGPVIGKLGRMLQGGTFDPFDISESTQVTMQMFEGQIRQYLNGERTPEGTRQMINQMESFFRSGRDMAGSVEGPAQLRDYMSILSSREFGQLVDELGGVPSNLVEPVTNLLREQYEGPLLQAIADRWEGVNISLGENVQSDWLVEGQDGAVPSGTPDSAIDVIWNGDGVTFVPKPGFENNAAVRSHINSLNQGENSIAGPLNTLIRAHGTLSGNDNLQQIWEQDYAGRLFGIGSDIADRTNQMLDSTQPPATALDALQPFSTEVEQSIVGNEGNWYVDPQQGVTALASLPTPSNLTMADFNNDIDRVGDIITSTNAENPQAMMNATSPIEVAAAYLGLSERRDQDNITLSRFIRQAAGINIDPAKTAWCAAFIDAVLHQSGQGGGTGQLNARSYMNWGQAVDTPQRGDVVVLWRGDPNGWQGHVGFFEGFDADGNIRVLGGNQGNQVSVASYPTSRLLGYRRAS